MHYILGCIGPFVCERASFWTFTVNNQFFSEPTDHKTGSCQNHPLTTEENALQFMRLAYGSLQGSAGTKK